MHVFVDGDVLAYRAGFAAEKTFYTAKFLFNGELCEKEFQYKQDMLDYMDKWEIAEEDYEYQSERRAEPVENALHNVKHILNDIKREFKLCGDDSLVVVLSGGTNFREEVAVTKPYKGNRDNNVKPTHLKAIHEYLIEHWSAVVTEEEEADDYMAYSHLAVLAEGDESIIATIDKDLDMVPGEHYNFVKCEHYVVDNYDAVYNFWHQMITGDSTDNIPGVPKYGAKKAVDALEECESPEDMCSVVRGLYVQAYGDKAEEVMTEQGRLLWMRTKPGEMWEIPYE